MHLKYHKTCRVCHSSALTKVIDLGEQYLQSAFVHPEKPLPSQRKIPTLLMRCDPSQDETSCGLLQLAHSVSPYILYSVYWYRSGTNNTMRTHLKSIADEAKYMVGKKFAKVLDIGCNDGTLLDYYPNSF